VRSGIGRHRVQAAHLSLSVGAVENMDKSQKSEGTRCNSRYRLDILARGHGGKRNGRRTAPINRYIGRTSKIQYWRAYRAYFAVALSACDGVGVQQHGARSISVGTIWITGNILLGIGVIVGRRRTYHVLREPENKHEAVTSAAISEAKRKDRNNLTIALVIVAALALAWQYFSGGQSWRTFFP
jgi:hypothetical protein